MCRRHVHVEETRCRWVRANGGGKGKKKEQKLREGEDKRRERRE